MTGRARDLEATVIALADLDELMALMNEGLRAAGVAYEEPAIHAGAAETAPAPRGARRSRDRPGRHPRCRCRRERGTERLEPGPGSCDRGNVHST